MLISRLRPHTNVADIKVALDRMNMDKVTTNRFAIFTTVNEQGAQERYLIQGKKKDADVKLIEAAQADRLVTFSTTENGLQRTMTGQVSSYTKRSKAAETTSVLAAMSGGISACYLGFATAVNAMAGAAHIGTMPGAFVGFLGLAAMIGGGAAYGRQVARHDNRDPYGIVLAQACEGGIVHAELRSIEAPAQ